MTADATLTHLNAAGEAHMVDVGHKPATKRIAIAKAQVRMSAHTAAALRDGNTPKGDVWATARIAGIQAAKETSRLIPLCHPVPLSHVHLDIELAETTAEITARAETVAGTGVEMEAMTAASVAALTLYDMLKGLERGIEIGKIVLERKEGGRSGVWQREATKPPKPSRA